MNKMFLVAGLAAFGLLAGACQLDVERNSDGSLQIEAVISEADIATEIALGMEAEEGTVTVRVTDRYVAVADTGIGMSQTDSEQAFTAFYRGELAKEQASGQGLGLALVRRLAQQLGWRVDLDSVLDQGTEFRVWYQ